MRHTEDRYINVDNILTRYREIGSGPPVLLVHGLGASLDTWHRVLPSLAPHGRVLALDLAGFGYTHKPKTNYTAAFLTQFIVDFLDALDIPTATIIGHSLGGSLALRMAIYHTNRIRKLVLVDSVGLQPTVSLGIRLLSLPFVGELLLKPSPEKTRQALKPLFYNEDLVTQQLVDLNYDLITQPGAQAAYLSVIRNMATIFGARQQTLRAATDHLHSIRPPTLIVWGKQDAVVPLSHGHAAATAIPNAQLKIIDRCGHIPMEEQSETFSDTVIRFLLDES